MPLAFSFLVVLLSLPTNTSVLLLCFEIAFFSSEPLYFTMPFLVVHQINVFEQPTASQVLCCAKHLPSTTSCHTKHASASDSLDPFPSQGLCTWCSFCLEISSKIHYILSLMSQLQCHLLQEVHVPCFLSYKV